MTASIIGLRRWFRTMARGWSCKWHTDGHFGFAKRAGPACAPVFGPHTSLCDMLHIEDPAMPTNLALDDKLIDEARRIGGHATKKEAVNAALDEYVRRRKQMKILKHFGIVDFD